MGSKLSKYEKLQMTFTDFLNRYNSKEEVRKIINEGIDKYKKHQAYTWHDDGCEFDSSGGLKCEYGRKIGDIANSDIEVLKSYTGEWEATYMSGCGKRWLTVADNIEWNISEYLWGMAKKMAAEDKEKVCSILEISADSKEDVIMDEWGVINAEILRGWFGNEFVVIEEFDNGMKIENDLFGCA